MNFIEAIAKDILGRLNESWSLSEEYLYIQR